MNKVILYGRLTKDIELKKNGELTYTKFSLAVAREFKKEEGTQADFINCITWGKTAENLSNFTQKGCRLLLQGRLQANTYEDKDGFKKTAYEVVADKIVFLDFRTNTEEERNKLSNEIKAPFASYNPVTNISDDDLPF